MTDTPDPDRSAEADDAELVRDEQEWLLERLREIPAERAALEAKERDLVHGARAAGISWDEIARAVGGFSAGWQAAEKYGEPGPDEPPF